MATIPTFRTLPRKGDFARGLEGLTARPRLPAELQPTGIAELDGLLGGGFPRGSIVELCGISSSGRTGLCLALLAQATGQQQACAFVDVSDSLDPASLAAAGVDAARLLWVRCGSDQGRDSSAAASSVHRPSQRARKETSRHDLPSAGKGCETPRTGVVWRHPRDQMRGIETSLPSLMRDESNTGGVGGPQMRAAFVASQEPAAMDLMARGTGEPVKADRELPRRAENVRCVRTPQNNGRIVCADGDRPNAAGSRKPWKRLEQALRTTDLLLHSGGWGVVVLDFGGISWVDVRRIPLSTWFRFQRIVESTPTILVLLGEEPCARGCASVALRCRRRQDKWRQTGSSAVTQGPATFQGFEVEGEIVRSRARLEHAGAACWQARSFWSQASRS